MNYHSFLAKGGEMGELTRAYDWSTTSLGLPGTWSQSLLSSVNIILTSKFPMLLFWGKELITFYNDAFRPSLGNDGKHPSSLGQPGHISWAESWPVIGPMIHNIINGSDAVWFEDQKLPIYREGKMGYAYWTYSFSPVLDDNGNIGGLLVTCNETTKAVESVMQLAESESRFQNLVRDASVGIIVLYGEDMKVEIVNDAYAKLIGRQVGELLHKPLFSIIPEARNDFEPILLSVLTKEQPLYFNSMAYQIIDNNGQIKEGYLDLVYQPFRETDNSVAGVVVLCQNVTEQVLSTKAIQNLNKELAILNEEQIAINEELTQAQNNLVAINKQLSESEERFRAMAESTNVFIGVSDETGNATYFNGIWSETTGRSNDALLEFGWADLIHVEDKEFALRNYKEAIENKAPFVNEFRILNKEGKYIWLLVQGIPRIQSDGTFAGHIGSAFDITERKCDEQRKNDFIGMVSHEMKTPLTSMSAYLQMLQLKAQKNEDILSVNMTDKAIKQVTKMTTLINGFLNVSRYESGKIQIHKQHFDMADLIKEVEEEVESTIKSHEIVFAPVEKTFVVADKDKIGQVISNFISNAVKYSPVNTIINIACITRDGMATVSVEDKGIGIKEEDKSKLFDRYYRVNDSSQSIASGFGIGLYLCAEIIQRHDGKLWVESEVGKGSTFSFSLFVAK